MATGRISVNKGRVMSAALGLAALVSLCLVPQAGADLEFCPQGPGAGQCAAPVGLNNLRGMAIDFETGHLYVADRNNNRVDVLKEDGTFLFAFGWGVADGTTNALQSCTATCFKGIAGSGAGQFDRPTKIAVDNIAASSSHHDVYVVDEPNSRVQKFDPEGHFLRMFGKGVNSGTSGKPDICTNAGPPTDVCGAGSESEAEGGFKPPISIGIGPGGIVHVLDNLPLPGEKFKQRLQRFKDTGEANVAQCILREGGRAIALAVDTGGNSWVVDQGAGAERALRQYNPSCTKTLEPTEDIGLESHAVAVDEANEVFVLQRENRANPLAAPFQVVTAHNPTTGALLSRFAYGKLPTKPEGLAVHGGGEGGVYVALGVESVPGHPAIKRLNFPPSTPPPHVPLPPPGPIAAPPSVEVLSVASTKASMSAEVNPEGKQTNVHIEYLTQAEYEAQGNSFAGGATKSTTPELLGAEGFKLKAFEKQIGCPNPAVEASQPGNKCLTPDTQYRWRIVATNADGGGEGTVEGAPFKTKESIEIGETYATDVGTDTARLHAEVNPLSIHATGTFEYVDDEHFQQSGFADASKAPAGLPLDFGAGEALISRSATVYPLEPGTTYHYRIVAEDPLIAVPGEAHVLRTFEPAGVEPCENEASRIGPGALLPDCRAYELVSPLDKGGGDIRVLRTNLGVPAVLEQSADSGEKLAYGSVRSFGDAQSAPYTSQYIAQRIAGKEWQTHSINPPRGRPITDAIGQADTEFKAFSTDLCDAWIVNVAEPVLGEGGVAGFLNLYRRHDPLCGTEGYGALAPIVTPVEGFTPKLLGTSADGTHAVFASNRKLAAQGTDGQQQLYESVGAGVSPRFVCILPGGAPVSGPCAAGSNAANTLPSPPNRALSEDGERIFFSASGAGEGKLYVRIGGTQTVAVSEAAETAAGTSASRFWAAAADGSKAVFTTGNLNEAKAKLYNFTLAGEVTSGPLAEGVSGVMGVSTDAKRIYFTSGKAIAGSGKNSAGKEAEAGKANLYLTEASGGTSFLATLASADLLRAVSTEAYFERSARITPDGAHAAFASTAPLTRYDNKGAVSGLATSEVYRYDANTKKLICASCNPSGARPVGAAVIPAFESPMHGARVISEDGTRLYFQSPDRLVARDTNSKVDVYQWEEAGAGGCEEADPGFSAAAEGCVELISSGQSPLDSRFVESSPSGKDVFFTTGSSLLPQDYGLVDIYDARVGGGLPVPPPTTPSCEGDACQNPPATPEAPTPAGETYVGPPEEASSGQGTKPRCAKGERRVTKKGKSHCVPKRKKQRHSRRAGR